MFVVETFWLNLNKLEYGVSITIVWWRVSYLGFYCILDSGHCIIHNVGADLRVCPNTTINAVSDERNNLGERGNSDKRDNLGEHIGSPLHRVVQWFKTMTTNEYIRHVKSNGWKRFDGKLWQRNYWEHIIRNEKSYNKISEYIKTNPMNWINDTLKNNTDDF